jgi:hypothetical protein
MEPPTPGSKITFNEFESRAFPCPLLHRLNGAVDPSNKKLLPDCRPSRHYLGGATSKGGLERLAEVLEILLVFQANVFLNVAVGQKMGGVAHKDRLGECLGIVQGHLHLQMPEIFAAEALDGA